MKHEDHYRVHKSSLLVRIPSQMNPDHPLVSYFYRLTWMFWRTTERDFLTNQNITC